MPLDVQRCPLDGINLIEASAGTGKTWAIAGLYLRLVLERGLPVENILVVTFTKPATAELRERLRARLLEALQFLRDGVTAEKDRYVADLVDRLGHQGMAREHMIARLGLALESFDQAAVFTIHGFCQRMLADTPFAAATAFQTELLHDATEFELAAVQDFWRTRLSSPTIAPLALGYLVAKGDTPKRHAEMLKRHLRQPLARVIGLPEPAAWDPHAEFDSRASRAAWERAREAWLRDPDAIVQCLIDARTTLNQGRYKESQIRKAALAMHETLRANEWVEPWQLTEPVRTFFSRQRIGKAVRNGKTAPVHPFFDLWQAVREATESLEEPLRLWRRGLLSRLLHEGTIELRARKRAHRVLDFDDLLSELYAALRESPDLAGRVRSRFPAALIDEFQDTDPLQFGIFKSLYSEGPGPLFLVGDPKQAIYSFRAADLHTYLRAAALASRHYSLAANQRSTAPMIEAVNGVFSAQPRPFLIDGLAFMPVHPGARRPPPMTDGGAPQAALQVWRVPARLGVEPVTKKPALHLSLRATAAEIARLLLHSATGSVRLGERALRADDIAILVRTQTQGLVAQEALRACGIGSVLTSQDSLYHSIDARDLAHILAAVLEPGRMRYLGAALATGALGWTAHEIAALTDDPAGLLAVTARYRAYAALWTRQGIGVMYRTLLRDENVVQRMLGRDDGDRRLTNLLHLGDALQQAATEHHAPASLLRWLRQRLLETGPDEDAELRLESDRNLVQILTFHRSKGLEFPIVFCPTIWEIHAGGGRSNPEGLSYHDDEGEQVIDYRDADDEGDGGTEVDAQAFSFKAIKERRAAESYAESMRLAYVGLTRAIHRCYLVIAPSLASGRAQSDAAAAVKPNKALVANPLNWLVAGVAMTPAEWRKEPVSADRILAGWNELAAAHPEAIAVSELSTTTGSRVPPPDTDYGALSAMAGPRSMPRALRITSYSGLSRGALNESVASDHDLAIVRVIGTVDSGVSADDIVRFPRGTTAGDCVHAVLERCDFTDRRTWDAAIDEALLIHPQHSDPRDRARFGPLHGRMLNHMLEDLTVTRLPGGVLLSEVALTVRMNEWSFWIPALTVADAVLNANLRGLGYSGPQLSFGEFSGYLRGFVDMVYQHGDRYWIADWKSNYLGDSPQDYGRAALADSMAQHAYHLQYLIYVLALHRHLQRCLPDYDYERDFGGVHYLFVRGVRPHWSTSHEPYPGVSFHRPERSTIERLDRLLRGDTQTLVGMPS